MIIPKGDLCIKDDCVEWRMYKNGDNVFDRFSLDDWNAIISGFSSNDEWDEFLIKYKDIISCFVLYKIKTNEMIAFSFIILENSKKNIYSFHGGGWFGDSLGLILYFRGIKCLFDYLFDSNIKLRTSCYTNNIKAYKLLKSIGFVRYHEKNNIYSFWLNKKRFVRSYIYNYLLGKKMIE